MKKTPFGLIPDDWRIGDLADAGKVVTGSTPPTADARNYGNDYPFVTPKEVGVGRYVGETSRGLSTAGGKKARLLPAKSVVFVCIGSTIGKVSQISLESASNQQINAITCNGSSDPGFLYYQLDFRAPNIRRLAGTQAVPIISKGLFEQVPLLFPPLPEQKKIAEILGACDEAIEAQERLIAQKQQRKKGLMQKLLTGEVRFPQFSGTTWREVELKDIVKPLSRKNTTGNTNVLTSSAKHGLVSQTDYFNKSVAGVNTSGYYLLKRGEFAYNRSSAKGYPYGAIKRLDFYDEGILSTLYLCFVFKNDSGVQSDFLAHLFEAGLLNHGLQAVCQQGARAHGLLNITKSDFYSLKFSIPSIEEQEAIENLLNAQYQEIALEQTKLEQLKQQKKGLMQQLLTGKVRVKI